MTPSELTALRQDLHRIPEVSGAEHKTAEAIAAFLKSHTPDQLLTGLAGTGVAAIYQGERPGPTVMIRAELDGLPIEELSSQPYRSTHAGRGHLCGHDGHMVMVAGLAPLLNQSRPKHGRAILLFQPAEETGQGAAALREDLRFTSLAPDYIFALHNLPGLELGHVAICREVANCASRGMRIRLRGRTSHAAEPQDGISPAAALSELLPKLALLGPGGELGPDYALSTVTHCHLGEATFGIAPGQAEIWVTLRCISDRKMAELSAAAETLATEVAGAHGLHLEMDYADVFEACVNNANSVKILKDAAETAGCAVELRSYPQKWSEDFGQFAKDGASAMFWLGSGKAQAQLHNPDYDFPDALLPQGRAVFAQVLRDLLG